MHCVVTGASSGIGRAVARRLVDVGADSVVVHYCHHRDLAEETADQVRQAGAVAHLVQGDIGSLSDCQSIMEQVNRLMPRIDVWAHVAGADVLTGDAPSWTFQEKLERLWEIDLKGTIALSRMVADQLLGQPDGQAPASMLHIGWDQAFEGMEGDAGQMFGPIKAAVMAFSRSLAQTLAPRVRVNCIAPGWIRTAWGETASEVWQSRAKSQSLMNRWGTPEDVAEAAAYLSGPAGSFITGQILNVNGGWNRQYFPKESSSHSSPAS